MQQAQEASCCNGQHDGCSGMAACHLAEAVQRPGAAAGSWVLHCCLCCGRGRLPYAAGNLAMRQRKLADAAIGLEGAKARLAERFSPSLQCLAWPAVPPHGGLHCSTRGLALRRTLFTTRSHLSVRRRGTSGRLPKPLQIEGSHQAPRKWLTDHQEQQHRVDGLI